MKISILLPYKENFSPNYGSVTFISDTTRLSKYKKYFYLWSTKYKINYKNYTNINFNKYFLKAVQILI